MSMPGRSYSAQSSYRYGFNGKENDNEVKGEGNEQDYGMRVYDTRLGRFLSLDPLQEHYPELTPYQFSSNSPIANVDLDGKESLFFAEMLEKYIFGTNHIEKIEKSFVDRGVQTIKNMIFQDRKIPDFVKQLSNFRLATTDPNIAKQNLDNGLKTVDYESKAIILGLVKNVSELSELAQKALKGDDKAIGALAFEIVMFFSPEFKEAGGVSKIAKITGEQGVIFGKFRAAIKGDLSAAAELRVAKSLREEGKNVHFIDADAGHAAGTGTFEFTVDGIRTEVKRLDGLGRNAVSDVAKAVRQVGENGEVIIVRPANSKFTLEQYKASFEKNFKPQIEGVKIKVVDESSLPPLLGKKKG